MPGLAIPGTESVGPGVTLAPAISVPASLDFGSVTIGQSQDLTVTVRNNGNAALTVSAATVTGATFRVTGPQTPFSVAVGGSQAVTVRFTPSAAGAVSGTLLLASNDPARASVTVSLTGNGTTVVVP